MLVVRPSKDYVRATVLAEILRSGGCAREKVAVNASLGNVYALVSDEDLMTRYYAGDDDAFKELDKRTRFWLGAMAFAMLRAVGKPRVGKEKRAEELAHETLLVASESKYQPAARWSQQLGLVRDWLKDILVWKVVEYVLSC
jgi:hypothetical protein